MKNILKWTFLVLAAVAAMAAGMYCLAQYFDSKELSSDEEAQSHRDKPANKAHNRHYTKLTLY